MQKRQVTRNAGIAVIQVIVTGITLFVLYRYLLDTIGVEQFGIWSVVLATTSASRISELGLSGSVVKFVARYLARDEPKATIRVIETATLSIGLLVGGMLLVVYSPIIWLLGYILPDEAIPAALTILPYALFSLWLTSIAAVFQSGLDGCQRIDLRGLIVIGGSILYLVFTMLFVPQHGLLGLAYAQVIQAGILLVASGFFLRRELPSLPWVPHHWNQPLFREMFWYGVNFQVVSIMNMLFDPLTKMLLAKFGSLGMVGYYEMANRMILQFRGLIISANQVLVPVIAAYKEVDSKRINKVYHDTYRMLVCISLLVYGAIATMIPLISEIWIGHYEILFVVFASILSGVWFLNTLSGPAYFNNLGTGQLRWNTIAHITMGILNVTFGLLLGMYFGGLGVVVASALALVVGSWVLLIAYHREHKIHLSNIFPKENLGLTIASCGGVGFGWFVYYEFLQELSTLALAVVTIAGFTALVVLPLWLHPVRHQIMWWLARRPGNTVV